MTEAEIRARLRAFITAELMREADYPLTDSETIPGRLIDSTGLAEVGVFVEQEFGVYIPDPELTVKAMTTLDHMVARVVRGLG